MCHPLRAIFSLLSHRLVEYLLVPSSMQHATLLGSRLRSAIMPQCAMFQYRFQTHTASKAFTAIITYNDSWRLLLTSVSIPLANSRN